MFNRISSRSWNDLMRHLATRYPITVQTKNQDEPNHAWKVTPSFDYKIKRWRATVMAGSVNCKIATINMAFDDAPKDYKDWLKLRYPEKSFRKEQLRIPLDFDPSLLLTWREIGNGAAPITVTESGGEIRQIYEIVPKYFQNQNVPAAGSSKINTPGTRRLFACDILLTQPRSYLVSEISILPGGPLGGSIVSVNPAAKTPQGTFDPPQVSVVSRYAPAPLQNSFADIFFQRFLDEPSDQIHLSTVYALSEPLGESTDFPEYVDETFTIMTRYYCHYNLAHATRVLPRTQTSPLTLATGLGAGLADAIFNYILSAQNDFSQAVLDLYQQRDLRGAFWVV